MRDRGPLNSLVKISGYNSKRLTEIAEQTRSKVERNRRVRNPRITGSGRFGGSTNEETLISLRRDVLVYLWASSIYVWGAPVAENR